MKHTSITLTSELKAKVQAYAEDHNLSANKAISVLIEIGLQDLGFVPEFAVLTSSERECVLEHVRGLQEAVKVSKRRRCAEDLLT